MEHTFGQFIGGISEDDKLVYEGQVLYAENLDLTSNSDYITLAPKPSLYATLSDEPMAMYYLKRGKNVLITSDDSSNVYYGGTLVYNADHDVRVFWSNSEYLFWYDYSEDVFYISLDDVWRADWTGYVNAGVTNLPSNVFNFPFVIENEDTAFLAHGTKIFEIDHKTTPGALVNTFDFLFDSVAGITLIAGQIKIFQEDGRVFLWDGVSESYSQAVDLGTGIDIVQQFGNREFLIGENTLYELEGFTLNKIASAFNSDKMQLPKMDIRVRMAQVVGNLKTMTYVAGDNIGTIEDPTSTYSFGDNAPVITYGEKKVGFPTAINNWITKSSQEIGYQRVYGVKASSGRLFIAYQDQNNNYYVDSVDLDAQNIRTQDGTGLLILPTFDGGNKKVEKTLEKIKIRADFGNDNGKFIICKVVDGELIPIDTDIATSTIEGEGDQEKAMIIGQNFFDVTLAVIFDQDNDYYKNSGALKFYHITLEYGAIKQK